MINNRILIIYSWEDKISINRMDLILKSQIAKDNIIDYFYAFNEPMVKVPNLKLFNKLDDKIRLFKPSIILLHTGGAFHIEPELFVNVIIQIKNKYPLIEYGRERLTSDDKYFINNDVFSNSPDITELEKLIFVNIFRK